MNCLSSLFSSSSRAPCGGATPTTSTQTIISQTVVQASSSNVGYLTGFQNELSLALGNAGIPIKGVNNPSQPNLHVGIFRNGISQNTVLATAAEIDTQGYGRIVRDVMSLL